MTELFTPAEFYLRISLFVHVLLPCEDIANINKFIINNLDLVVSIFSVVY